MTSGVPRRGAIDESLKAEYAQSHALRPYFTS